MYIFFCFGVSFAVDFICFPALLYNRAVLLIHTLMVNKREVTKKEQYEL